MSCSHRVEAAWPCLASTSRKPPGVTPPSPPGHWCPHTACPSSLLRLVLYRHPSLIPEAGVGWGVPVCLPFPDAGVWPWVGRGCPLYSMSPWRPGKALGAGPGATARPALSPQLGVPEAELHLQRVVPQNQLVSPRRSWEARARGGRWRLLWPRLPTCPASAQGPGCPEPGQPAVGRPGLSLKGTRGLRELLESQGSPQRPACP